jgi:hypothetical protein
MCPAFAVDQSYERLLGDRKQTTMMFQLLRRRRDGATAQLLTGWGQTPAVSRVCTLRLRAAVKKSEETEAIQVSCCWGNHPAEQRHDGSGKSG